MSNTSKTPLELAKGFMILWLLSCVAANVGVLVYTRSLDLILLGVAASLMLLGPTIVSLGLMLWKRNVKLAWSGYVAVWLGLLGLLTYGWWQAKQMTPSDGGAEFGMVILIMVVFGGIVGLLTFRWQLGSD